MLVSTFELLLNKPQLPRNLLNDVPQLLPLVRELIQGYFLTISNQSAVEANLLISFKVLGDPSETQFDDVTTESFYDFNGNNMIVAGTAGGNLRTYAITLPAHDTGLFILQPDPSLLVNLLELNDPTDNDIADSEVEIRGSVSIDPHPSHPQKEEVKILIAAEHRATFYNLQELLNSNNDDENDQLQVLPDQITYSLPIAGGDPLLKFPPKEH